MPGLTLNITLTTRTYKGLLWLRNQSKFPIRKSAIVERAMVDLLDRMGYYTATDKEQLAQDLAALERRADVI